MSTRAAHLAELRAPVSAIPAPAEPIAALAVVDAALAFGEASRRWWGHRAGAAIERATTAIVHDAAFAVVAVVARGATLAAVERIATAVVCGSATHAERFAGLRGARGGRWIGFGGEAERASRWRCAHPAVTAS
jgi:hypothetical protein